MRKETTYNYPAIDEANYLKFMNLMDLVTRALLSRQASPFRNWNRTESQKCELSACFDQ